MSAPDARPLVCPKGGPHAPHATTQCHAGVCAGVRAGRPPRREWGPDALVPRFVLGAKAVAASALVGTSVYSGNWGEAAVAASIAVGLALFAAMPLRPSTPPLRPVRPGPDQRENA